MIVENCRKFLRSQQLTFVSDTDVVVNIKLGAVIKEQGDDSTSSLAAFAIKPVNKSH